MEEVAFQLCVKCRQFFDIERYILERIKERGGIRKIEAESSKE